MSAPFSHRVWRKLRTIGALTYYAGVLPIIRIPTLLPFVFATPFTILFILFVTGRGDAFAYGLVGAMAMTIAQQGLILGADLTNFKIEHKFQAMVVASPVSAMTYMVAVALSELAFASPPVIILLLITGYTVTGITAISLVEIVGVLLLTWITTSSIGFFLSTYVLNTRTAFITISFLSILVSVLPPVFYPIQVIPSQFRWLAELVPTTHASILLQNAIGLQIGTSQVILSWLALPAFTIAFLSLALFKARWREP